MCQSFDEIELKFFSAEVNEACNEQRLTGDDDDASDAVCTCTWHLMPVWNLLCRQKSNPETTKY